MKHTNKHHGFFLYLTLSCLFLSSCGVTADFIADDFQQPQNIVVLPTVNNTIDISAGDVLRSVAFVNLYNYQYGNITPVVEADSILREAGITDGGQLPSISMIDLHNILEADGILLIELEEATYNTIGLRREERVIHAHYSLYSFGNIMYQHETKVEKKSRSLLGGAFDVLTDPGGALVDRLGDTGVRLVRGLFFEHDLLPEIEESINEMILTLPGDKRLRGRRDRI